MSGAYLPEPEWLVRDWYRACVETGSLCIQRCDACETWRHHPRRFCAACGSDRSRFEPVRGTGTVVSWCVSHRSLDPGWQAEVPYATLVVELDEGPRVLAATRTASETLGLGLAVHIAIEARSESFAQLWGEPVRNVSPPT